MAAYYNEFDPFAAAWLRNLIGAGHIAAGDVDERSIADVRPADLAGYERAHFFAGIAGWDLALQLAGWPAGAPVWTGSCPCQPFSAAGKRRGIADERHLWPVWFEFIRECRPPVIIGEQVEAAIAHGWLDAVFDDLEGAGYACGAAIAPACGVGAPHIRQRLWWVGYAECERAGRDTGTGIEAQEGSCLRTIGDSTGPSGADDRGLGDPGGPGLEGRAGEPGHDGAQRPAAERAGGHADGLGDAEGIGQPSSRDGDGGRRERASRSPGWDDLVWLPCSDGKARPTQPGLFPLVAGLSGRVAVVRPGEQAGAAVQDTRYVSRVGALRCAGNAIVPALAAEFVAAVMEHLRLTAASGMAADNDGVFG